MDNKPLILGNPDDIEYARAEYECMAYEAWQTENPSKITDARTWLLILSDLQLSVAEYEAKYCGALNP
jgi:hypothetical protein